MCMQSQTSTAFEICKAKFSFYFTDDVCSNQCKEDISPSVVYVEQSQPQESAASPAQSITSASQNQQTISSLTQQSLVKQCSDQCSSKSGRALHMLQSCFVKEEPVHSKVICDIGCILQDKLMYKKGKREYKFKHIYSYEINYAFDKTTGIWLLAYIANVGMYCLLCKFHHKVSDQNKSNTVWTETHCVKVNVDATKDHIKGQVAAYEVQSDKAFVYISTFLHM